MGRSRNPQTGFSAIYDAKLGSNTVSQYHSLDFRSNDSYVGFWLSLYRGRIEKHKKLIHSKNSVAYAINLVDVAPCLCTKSASDN